MGLELARQMSGQVDVIITGRTDPNVDFAKFQNLELTGHELPKRIGEFVAGLPEIDLCVYAAGFAQEGSLTDLADDKIEAMLDVGARSLIYVTRELLKKQGHLDELAVITSSSQYTPRPLEAVYNFVKSGEALFSSALAEDSRVGKVLVAAPSGMRTAFWRDRPDKDTSGYLDPEWVAGQIGAALRGEYRYKEIRLQRGDPPTIEEVETR